MFVFVTAVGEQKLFKVNQRAYKERVASFLIFWPTLKKKN